MRDVFLAFVVVPPDHRHDRRRRLHPAIPGGRQYAFSKLDASVSASVVLLDELSPGGAWVEPVNAGDTTVDLSGWMVADATRKRATQ